MSLDDLMNKGSKISALMSEGAISNAKELSLDLIELDPEQPRKEFDEQKIAALGLSIKEHGVLQPISVRSNPDKKGYFIINYGERRYRAAKSLGLKTIKAFLEETFSRFSQAVENIVREDLTLIERVLFIKEQIEAGKSQKEITRLLGHHDASWVSRHVTIIDAPALITTAMEAGQIKSIEVAHTLTSRWQKGQEAEVKAFIASVEEGETVTTTLLRKHFDKGNVKGDSKIEGTTTVVKKDDRERLVKKLKKLDIEELSQIKNVLDNKVIFNALISLNKTSIESVVSLLLYAMEGDDFDSIDSVIEEAGGG